MTFRRNSAGFAGGGLFIDCPRISQACTPLFDAKLGLPRLKGHMLETLDNSAGGYGDSLAQAPMLLTVTNFSQQYVPGRTRDVLRMIVGLQDEMKHQVRGSDTLENPYRLRLRFCPHDPESQKMCTSKEALQADVGLSLAAVDAFTDVSVFGVFLRHCLVGRDQVAVSIYLDGDLFMAVQGLRRVLLLECLPCGEGEARVESIDELGRRVHTCHACGTGEYVVDNNNRDVTCQRCPPKGKVDLVVLPCTIMCPSPDIAR